MRWRAKTSSSGTAPSVSLASNARGFVKLVDDFPKTAIGKIQKNVLRAQYGPPPER